MLILIYGITGMVGHAVARAALRAGHQVRGTSRNPDKLDKDVFDSLTGFVKLGDIYDTTALDKAVHGVDAIISASYYSPDAIVDGQILLLRAAERAGVKIFHASSWNYDWKKLSPGDCEPYDPHIIFFNHARISSPINPIYGFTGGIMEYVFLHSKHSNPIDKKAKTFSYAGNVDDPHIFTSVENLAEYSVQAISESNADKGGSYYVDSFRASPKEMAQAYEEANGVHLELKYLGSAKEVNEMLDDYRAKTPTYKFLDVPEYTGLAYASNQLRGVWNYDSVDSNGRWNYIKRVGAKEWFIKYSESI